MAILKEEQGKTLVDLAKIRTAKFSLPQQKSLRKIK
jgi:hypothetical protein